MALKKGCQELIHHCINAWSGETGQPHIKFVGIIGEDATITKHILDALEGHCEPRNNETETVAATAYRHLVQGDLGLPEYIEKCKEVTAACNFEAGYEKYLWNAILIGLRNQKFYEKCFEVGDKLTSTDVIHIATEV